jgi:exosortase
MSILCYLLGRNYHVSLNQNDYVSLVTFAAILFINGAFILCYGVRTFRAALFPLLFLIFMVPIPTFLLDRIIHVLLVGSTAFTELLFKITGAPYIREGATFHLPGISIEVANVCSGIRSSLALFITMVIAAHLFLKTNWKKVVLLLAIFPITVFKNGVRIVTISLLATYVDERFLTHSWLHQSGGIVFFIPALILLGLILWALKKSDGSTGSPRGGSE